jgi:hypothetical protein
LRSFAAKNWRTVEATVKKATVSLSRARARVELSHAAVGPDFSDLHLIDACEAYHKLTGEWRPLLMLYMYWFRVRNPQYYKPVPEVSYLNKEYRDTDRLLFFREILPRISYPSK